LFTPVQAQDTGNHIEKDVTWASITSCSLPWWLRELAPRGRSRVRFPAAARFILPASTDRASGPPACGARASGRSTRGTRASGLPMGPVLCPWDPCVRSARGTCVSGRTDAWDLRVRLDRRVGPACQVGLTKFKCMTDGSYTPRKKNGSYTPHKTN
jgi:hypothetical protein